MLRAGLKDCFVFDLVNAHINILLERHPPAEGSALLEYCQNREAVLQQTHADRGTAKNLFLRLLYGGSVQNWKKVHNIDTFATEPLAARFALEMRQIKKADCGANAEKMKKLKQVTPRPAEYLQYALNTAKERELIDKAIQVVEDAGGTVLALEHDGLFVHLPAEEFETFNRDMQCALGVNYPYTLQPTPSVEKALEKAKLVMCQGPLEHLWHLKDEEWRTHHHLICQAYTGNLAHHGLFAEVMLRSPAVNTNIPYSITQIFKILVDTGHKAWYSCQHLQWIITGDSAMDSLKSCIQIIAQRDLGHYHTTWTTESNEVRVSTRWDFSAEPFKNSVAQSLRPHLGATSELWALDGAVAQGHSGDEDIALHRLDASLAILVDDSRPTDSCSAPQGSRSTGPPRRLRA